MPDDVRELSLRALKRVHGVTKLNGRPTGLVYSEKTLKQLEGTGKIQCTRAETAAALGVTQGALQQFFEDWPDALELWERARENGKKSLRRKQIDVALKGNPTMLIWTGKQYLGQRDQSEVVATVSLESLILASLTAERGSLSQSEGREPVKVNDSRALPASEGPGTASEGHGTSGSEGRPAASEGLPAQGPPRLDYRPSTDEKG